MLLTPLLQKSLELINDSTEKTTKTLRHEENLKDKLQIIGQSEVESEFSCAKP